MEGGETLKGCVLHRHLAARASSQVLGDDGRDGVGLPPGVRGARRRDALHGRRLGEHRGRAQGLEGQGRQAVLPQLAPHADPARRHGADAVRAGLHRRADQLQRVQPRAADRHVEPQGARAHDRNGRRGLPRRDHPLGRPPRRRRHGVPLQQVRRRDRLALAPRRQQDRDALQPLRVDHADQVRAGRLVEHRRLERAVRHVRAVWFCDFVSFRFVSFRCCHHRLPR